MLFPCDPISIKSNSRYKLTFLSTEMFLYYAIFHAILYLSNITQCTNWSFYQRRCFSIMLFPCDPLSIKSNSGGPSSNTKSSSENSGDENIRMKSYKNLPNNDKDTETSDFLLAKALYHVEKDEADLYKKPRGKSYRQSKENKALPDLTSLPDLTPRPITPPANHMTSSSESSDVEDEEVINTSLISFISKKKKLMLSLVSDPLSKYHARSDRLSALQRLSSIRRLEKNAEKEMTIIRL